MPNDVYAVGGYSNVAPGVIVNTNPPPPSFKGKIGQMYFDKSITPPSLYIFNGSTWELVFSATKFPITPFVVGPFGEAGFQTIQDALDAAFLTGSAQAIYVQPGTYVENLTFPNINITLWGDRGLNATVIGTHTPSPSSSLEIHQLLLVSTTDILNSNVAGSSSIEFSECFIVITNGFVFNLPNWTGIFLMDDCGEASTDDGVVNNTAGVNIKFLNTEMGAGSGKVFTVTGNGFVRFDTCNVNCQVNIAGTGSYIVQNGCKFANTVTIGGSKGGNMFDTAFETGASQALTYNSSGNSFLSGVVINSSNNPAIGGTGVGVLKLDNITWVANANVAGTLTTTGLTITPNLNNTQGVGVLTILSTNGNPGNNTGFIETLLNGATVFIPYFSDVSP